MLVKPLVRPIVRAIAGNPTASLGSGFSPTSLFLDGSKGVVYDNNDLSSFYLDSAGTTAATVNGLVGLQLDKSANLALGAELCDIGVFDSATGWTVGPGWVVSGGVATGTATSSSLKQNGVIASSGKWYKVEFDWTHTGGTLYVMIGAGSAATFTTSGRKVCYLLSSGTGGVEFYGGSVSGTLDNVSVKELPGNHRYQTTTGSKPVLRGTPTGASLVTNGDFATDTVWNKGTGWSIGSGVATKVAGTTNSLLQSVSVTAGKVYRLTYTITATAGGVQPLFSGGTSAFGVLRTASGTYVEWLTANTGNVDFGFTVNALFAGTVDNVEIVDVSAGQVTAPYGLQYDGVDDFMQTAAVDFTATDKMFVCAGVRKLSDAAVGLLAELSANVTTNAGAFAVFAPLSTGLQNFNFQSAGTALSSASKNSLPAPTTRVLSCVGNISGDVASITVSGETVATAVTDQGTGNYGNYAIYFGRRGGTANPYNGLDFGFVICGKTLTSTQISQTERYIAQRTGISI